MHPRFKPLAALLALLPCCHAQAQQLAALDTVVVTATRQQMRVDEVLSDTSVIERSDIEAAGHTNLEEILAAQPGIQMASNGSPGAASYLYFRGTNPKHVLLLIDGMRIGSATSGEPTWSRIPAAQIERIEITRGPASALYGSDAIGGVVQIFTRRGEGPLNFSAEAGAGSYGTRSASAALSGSQQGWRYALSLSDDSTDGFDSKPKDTKVSHDRDGFYNHAASGHLGYEFAPGHELGLSMLYAEGRSQYDSTGVAVDWANRTRNGAASLVLKNALNSHWNSTLSVGKSIDNSTNLKDGTRYSIFDTEQRQYAWQHDILGNWGNFLVGLERQEQEIESMGNYKQRERRNDAVQLGWNRGFDAHRLQASVRHDDDSLFGSKTTGSLAYGYRFSPNWRTSMSVGTAFKAPTFNELYYPKTGSYVGNPDVQPETALNREIALHYETGSQAVSLTWYRNRIEDMIVWAKVGTVNQPSNVDTARIEGATLAWQGRLGDFNLHASYDWLDAEDANTGKQLTRRAKQTAEFAIGQNIGSWDWRVEWLASSKRYDDKANTTELGGYALTHLYGAYRFAPDWSIFARVNNLFDKDYVLADGYATPGRNAFIGLRYSPK